MNQRELELSRQEEHSAQLDEQIVTLKHANHLAKDECSQLKITISALDREKDSLQLGVDEKTEKMATLSDNLLHKVFPML